MWRFSLAQIITEISVTVNALAALDKESSRYIMKWLLNEYKSDWKKRYNRLRLHTFYGLASIVSCDVHLVAVDAQRFAMCDENEFTWILNNNWVFVCVFRCMAKYTAWIGVTHVTGSHNSVCRFAGSKLVNSVEVFRRKNHSQRFSTIHSKITSFNYQINYQANTKVLNQHCWSITLVVA